MSRDTFFATCGRGLEGILLAESRALGLARCEGQPGGVRFTGTMSDAARANAWLRTANRVLLVLGRFPVAGADDLYEGASAVDWSPFLGPDGTFEVRSKGRTEELRSDLFVAQRVKDAVADAFRRRHGRRPSVDRRSPDLSIHVRISGGRATLLADTSGAPLFKRGWRRVQGRAPMKETLAAALVMASGWDRRAPLLDPFCGSGTILVEGALLAAGVPPGAFRKEYAYQGWPGFSGEVAASGSVERPTPTSLPRKLTIAGWDLDPRAVAGARENAAAAGFGDRIEIAAGDVSDFRPRRGWNAYVVTNPPYGERIGEAKKMKDLYRRFARVLEERCRGYRVTILSGNRDLARCLPFPPERVLATKNGPIDCEVLRFVAG